MAKRKKKKLPKRIGGIKIPNALRKSSGSLAALFQTKAGREAVAAGLVAMAGSLLGTETGRKTAGNVGEAAMGAGAGTADALGTIGKAAGTVVAEAARHVLPSSLAERHPEPSGDSAAVAGPRRDPEPTRRKTGDKPPHIERPPH